MVMCPPIKKKKVVYMRLWGLPALGWHSGSAMAANALPSPGGSFHLLEVEGKELQRGIDNSAITNDDSAHLHQKWMHPIRRAPERTKLNCKTSSIS